MKKIKADIAIFGAGIAGLWLLRALKNSGYEAILIEKAAIGGTQTLASQGMIHGGQRYTLQGVLSGHAQSISTMPVIWDNLLEGHGEPDLKNVNILSSRQFLWSPGGLTSNITAFFASKAMNSRVTPMSDTTQYPEIFKTADFSGKLYELSEKVLDVKSLARALAEPVYKSILKADEVQYEFAGKELKAVVISRKGETAEITAGFYIFAAARGNEEVATALFGAEKVTQCRPLKQIMVKELDLPLYAHCLTTDPRPRVTVSAHPLPNGKYVWYLGGLVALYGLNKSDSEAISNAAREMRELFPWINWSEKLWSTCLVDRAEPYSATGFLPDGPALKVSGNAALTWPTKLTFAPAVAQKILDLLQTKNFRPAVAAPGQFDWESPDYGVYPWENATWQKL